MSTTLRTDQVRLMALCRIPDINWNLVAREAQRPGGLDRLLDGQVTEASTVATSSRQLLRQAIKNLELYIDQVHEFTEGSFAHGTKVTTVLDEDYPSNLRLISNLPPFLFYRGDMGFEDAHAVAVVGTRQASDEGLRLARRMAKLLVQKGVTVLSGLARGIDTAAHEAALAANGRTIAVLGSGIDKIYPPENEDLARSIEDHGAVVSQFWPMSSPGRHTFPLRNVVTSGLAQGTVVIEASKTSGAKMQARLAHEHGKQVFLVASLVAEQPWARDAIRKRKAIEVDSVDDIVALLRPADVIEGRSKQVHQEALALG